MSNYNDNSTTNPLFCDPHDTPPSSSTHEATTLSLFNDGSSDGVHETRQPTIPIHFDRIVEVDLYRIGYRLCCEKIIW